MTEKNSRKQQILAALVEMLSQAECTKITTAKLAEQVNVTEAALYRHFPSKAKMYEALIEFIEETLFPRIHHIKNGDAGLLEKIDAIMQLILTFAERNTGICRLLTGEILLNERASLTVRITQIFERIALEIKQIIRAHELSDNKSLQQTAGVSAQLLTSLLSGYINHFTRSGFTIAPTTQWQQHKLLINLYA